MSYSKECVELKCYLKYSIYYSMLSIIFIFLSILFYISGYIVLLIIAIIFNILTLFFIFMIVGNIARYIDLKKNIDNFKTYKVKFNDIRKTIGRQYYFVVKIKDENNKIKELNTSSIFSTFTMGFLLKSTEYLDKMVLIAYDNVHDKAITIKQIKK